MDANTALRRKFAALKERYFILFKQRLEGEFTLDEFMDRVNNLRGQDREGTWWQIRGSDVAWLKWDGGHGRRLCRVFND